MRSLLSSVLGGLFAGAVGTLAMDLVWYVRYRRGGGQGNFTSWEFPSDVKSWDETSAPAKVGKLLVETSFHTELPATRAALTTNVMHWGYGVQWGVVFGVAVGSSSRVRPWQGPLLGLLVWLASYLSLPIAGFYMPIWSYDLKTLWADLSAHLVYGSSVAAAFWAARRP
jgi:uncharacterized membrane protein YagU involved in acid resistance